MTQEAAGDECGVRAQEKALSLLLIWEEAGLLSWAGPARWFQLLKQLR